MGWWVAGGLMVVLILVVAWPILQREPAPAMGGAAATGTAAGNPAAGPSAVDLSTMSPREAADRLFDRVMRTAAAGDSATAISFVPMTVSAYDQARPLDADGLFHLASVQRVAGDHAAALAAAQEALEGDPDHLLALHAAAQAAVDLGDTATALTYYRHVLEVWDAEMGSGLFDYEAHASMMDEVRRTAQAFVAGNGG
jgi:tetratricopeptide (TPR) repeat protein